jgi:hypothetical protein
MILTQVLELYYIPHIRYIFRMKLTGPIPTFHMHRIRISEPYSNLVRFATSGYHVHKRPRLSTYPLNKCLQVMCRWLIIHSNFLCAHKNAADVLCLFGRGV